MGCVTIAREKEVCEFRLFGFWSIAVMNNKRYAGAFFGALSKELYDALEGGPADNGVCGSSGMEDGEWGMGEVGGAPRGTRSETFSVGEITVDSFITRLPTVRA